MLTGSVFGSYGISTRLTAKTKSFCSREGNFLPTNKFITTVTSKRTEITYVNM